MTLDMPTPESLEAEANDLEARAEKKERQAVKAWAAPQGAALLEADAQSMREHAASKRAKAERLRKAAQ